MSSVIKETLVDMASDIEKRSQMRRKFSYLMTEKAGKNKAFTTLRMMESYPEWYVLFPWLWLKLLEGDTYTNVRFEHPFKGGYAWRRDVRCLNTLVNKILDRDDWYKIWKLIEAFNPSISMAIPVTMTKPVKVDEKRNDMSRPSWYGYTSTKPGRTELKEEVIKVKKSSADSIEWDKEPRV